MKTIFKSVMGGAVAMAAVTVLAAEPAEKAAAEKAAAEKAAEKASVEAWKKLDGAATARMRKDFDGYYGFANYWHSNIDAAREMYESALTNAVMRNPQKIAAIRKAAQMHLEATRDTKAALATMERAFALPGLTDAEKKQAEAAKLDLRRLMRLEPADPAKATAKASPTLEERAKAIAAAAASGRAPDANAVRDYCYACRDAGYETFFGRVPALLKDLSAKHPKVNYWGGLWGIANGWECERRPSAAQRDPRFAVSYVALLESAPTNFAYSAEQLLRYADGKPGLEVKCRGYAEKIVVKAVDPKARVNAETLAQARRVILIGNAGNDPKKIVAACREFLASQKKADDKTELAKLIGEEAQRRLKAGDVKGARALWDERLRIAPEKAQSKLGCPYWKDAPTDIRGIVESDLYKKAPKGLFTHRYGDNLKFLIETDAAMTGRTMTTDDGKAFRPTELFAFCDALGVKILLRAFVDNAAEVKSGEADPPGYETYLATDIDAPYHCIMFDGDKADNGLITQYDNGTGYRCLQKKLGNLKCENLCLDDSVVTLISVPWTSTAASLPSATPAWYFEAIHWDHGGLSWGGSKSVHGRSNCGALTFTGVDDAALAAIRRTVLRRAHAEMRQAMNTEKGGYAEIWRDPVLGDQDFWTDSVKPYLARINADLARVKKESTPAEIAAVFATGSVDDALNINYRIAQLRTEWLEDKMTKK